MEYSDCQLCIVEEPTDDECYIAVIESSGVKGKLIWSHSVGSLVAGDKILILRIDLTDGMPLITPDLPEMHKRRFGQSGDWFKL